ncbi:MAG: hypothetical protein U0324_09065 [Polyangiales bacterium]
MRARLVAAVLLSACRPLAFVGSADDGAVDVFDAPRDRDDDVNDVNDTNDAAVPPDVAASDERLGLGGRGLAVTYDGLIDGRAIRFVYVGDDGALHVERRDSDTLGRQCERAFEPPGGYTLVSAPTVPLTSGVVLVAAREAGSGHLRFFAMAAQDVPSTCGHGFSAWGALPDAPAGSLFASAPGAVTLPLMATDGGPRVWAFAVTEDGALLATEASLVTAALSWAPWSASPPLPPGERALSAPSMNPTSGRAFQVTVLAESPGGRRRFLTRSFDVLARLWTPTWEGVDAGAAEPDSGWSATLFQIDPRFVRGGGPYGAWRLFRARTGAYWTQVSVDRPDALPGFSAWSDAGNPFADRGVKPSAPVIASRRNAREVAGELLVLSTPAVGPRVVRYTTTWRDAFEDPPGRWREAPDPLR